MSNSTIIELKEAYDTTKITDEEDSKHGEFVNTLNKDILITEGTQVLVRQVFIDSVAKNTEKIQIDEDTEVSISVCRYWTNNTLQESNLFDYYSLATPTDMPDGFDYFECKLGGNVNSFYKIQDLWIQAYGSSMRGMGGTHGQFRYTNADGAETDITIYIETIRSRDFTPHGNPASLPSGDYHRYDSICNIDSLDGRLICLNLDDLHDHHIHFGDQYGEGNLVWVNNPTPITGRGNDVSLLTDTYTFTIPKNKKGYDPAELARFITDEITDLGEGTITANLRYFNKNPLENGKTQTTFLKPVSECKTGADNNIWINSNGTVLAQYKSPAPANDIYAGASQIALEWGGDEGVESFKWTALHTPLYDTGGSPPSKTFITKCFEVKNAGGNALSPPLFFMSGRSGGVGFTDLSPASFWYDKLGFSNDILLQPPHIKKPAGSFGTLITNPNGATVPNLEGTNNNYNGLKNGTNLCDNFKGLDSVLVASSGNLVPTDPSTIVSTTSTTNMIYGNNPFTDTTATDGYFLIDLNLGFGSTDWKGVSQLDYGNKVKAIVNRYYATDTYTSANTEASIPYIHKGVPVRLSEVSVIIKDSQGNTLYNEIGDDNSIFLEIIPPPVQNQ